MVGNLSKERKPWSSKIAAFATGWQPAQVIKKEKKRFLIILIGASCFRTERANKLNPCI
jgi:hypothetical protein